MRVKPKEGMKIRDPVTGALVPDSGIEVPDTDIFWLRRLRDGDAEKVEAHASRRQEPRPSKEA